MCAAVPVALLLLAVFAALTALRLTKNSPNANLLADLHNTTPDQHRQHPHS